MYLRDIGRVKLLTPHEENELAVRIKQGDEEAREEMIKANLPLVVKIARSYEGMGVPLLDLISEGNIGLMKAVERFDPSKGAKLSYYSAYWIKQAITRALASQSKTIRIPQYVVEELGKMARVSLRLEAGLGRAPTDEELAWELGASPGRVAQMRKGAVRTASLDAQYNGEGSRSLSEMIADEKAEMPDQKLEDKGLTETLLELLPALDQRQRAILHSYFGLNGQVPKTLEAIAEELGITHEGVRQLRNAALRRLRRMFKELETTPA